MATVRKPIALNETFKTTEQTPRNLADVLAQALQALNTTISGLNFINCVVVQTLPTADISTTTIYLVPKNPAQTDNLYDEYINLTGTSAGWEKIGDTEIDLSDYYNKTETDTLLSGKVDKVNGKGLSTNDYTTAEKTKLAGIEAGAEVNPTSSAKTATESFETVNGGLLSKCMIDLEPVQDLHGYDNPWVGGARKNKIPMTLANIKSINTDGTWVGNVYTHNNVIFTVNTDSGENVTGIDVTTGSNTATGTVLFLLCGDTEFNGDYVLNGCPANGSTNTYSLRLYIGGNYGGYQDIGSGVNLSPTGSNNRFGIRIGSGASISSHIVFKPMLRLSSVTDATFEPYSNICPISGHTEVDLYNVGKNILDLSNVSTETINGITFTVTKNSSGAITEIDAHGTATAEVTKWLLGNNWTYDYCAELPDTLADNTAYSLLISPNDNANAYIQIALKRSNNINIFSWKSVAGSTTQTTPVIDKNSMRWNGWIRIINGTVLNHKKFYPMLYLTSEPDATYEPYLGHLYQVQIGETVYGCEVDLVTGVMTVDKGFITLNGTENITKSAVTDCDIYIYTITPANFSQPFITSAFKYSSTAINAVGYAWRGSSDTQIRIGYAPYGTTTVNDFKTWLSNNPLQICYKLATPTTIQLTPQQIETLSGQNNLSTPLSGQSIETNGVEYKELFTFADVKEYVKPLIPYSNAGSHNAIYRGKYLGDHVTPEQWASIVAGTFDDLFIGDYWTINSVNWRIAHFDYWLGTGDTECTNHHVVIVPDSNLYKAKINTNNDTTGGYYGSEMRGGANYLVSGSSNLYQASEDAKSAFGSAHILTHRELLTNAVTSGNSSGWSWYDSSVDLMNEVMVYGTLAWSVSGKGYEVASGKGQLALFSHNISKVTNREHWWLRSVFSNAHFAVVSGRGYAEVNSTSTSNGVRPCFAIK